MGELRYSIDRSLPKAVRNTQKRRELRTRCEQCEADAPVLATLSAQSNDSLEATYCRECLMRAVSAIDAASGSKG